METINIPISVEMRNELDKLREEGESYEDVILRLMVDLENLEGLLRSFIEKSN